MGNDQHGFKSTEPNGYQEITQLIDRGQQALEQGRFQEAVDNFRQALRLAPFRSDVKEMLALALAGRSIPAREEEQEDTDISQPITDNHGERAKPWETKLLVTAGLWLVICILLVVIFLGLFTFYNEAIKGTIISLADKSKIKKATTQKTLDPHHSAKEYLRQGQYNEAIMELRTALKGNPSDAEKIKEFLAEGYYGKAQSLYRQGKFELAGNDFAQAASYMPSVKHFYQAGWSYYKAGREAELNKRPVRNLYNKAINAYDQAINLEPQHLPAIMGLAGVYIRLNRQQQAIPLYEKVIQIDPRSPEADKARRNLESMLGKKIQ